MALEVHRIPLSEKEPKENGPKNKCKDCKLSNTTTLQMFNKMTLEFLTYKKQDGYIKGFNKCNICGDLFRETVKLVHQAINKHEGLKQLENKY